MTPTQVQIDDCLYRLDAPKNLTDAQHDLYQLLKEGAQREIPLDRRELKEALGLRSVLPVDSRIRNLIKKGSLELLLKWKDCPICSLSGVISDRCVCEGTGKIGVIPRPETSP